MKKKLGIYVLVFYLTSCAQTDRWTSFQATGLPTNSEGYECLIFENDTLGYLGGSRLIGEKTFRTVLYKTTDQGQSWQAIPTQVQGEIKRVFSFDDTLLLLNQSIMGPINSILYSSNSGRHWETILAYPSSSYIRAIFFTNPEKGYAVVENQELQKQFLLRYHSQWDTLVSFSPEEVSIAMSENSLYCLVADQQAGKGYSSIKRFSLEEQSSQEFPFEEPIKITASALDEDQNLYLASQGTSTTIYKITEQGLHQIELSGFQDYWVDQIHAFQGHLRLTASKKKSGSILGVTHELLVSEDGGVNWTLEAFPFPLIIKPSTMKETQFFLAYSGAGSFQKRK